jgi:hypothetical protein
VSQRRASGEEERNDRRAAFHAAKKSKFQERRQKILRLFRMGSKKGTTQKNTRHHFATTASISKKRSAKAKLRNQDLCSQLDKTTGLAGAASLFHAPPKKVKSTTHEEAVAKAKTDKAMEEDVMALMSMQLSSTKAH